LVVLLRNCETLEELYICRNSLGMESALNDSTSKQVSKGKEGSSKLSKVKKEQEEMEDDISERVCKQLASSFGSAKKLRKLKCGNNLLGPSFAKPLADVLLSSSSIVHMDIGSGNNLRLSGVETLISSFWRANDLPLEYFGLSEPTVSTSVMLDLALSFGNLDHMRRIDLGRSLRIGNDDGGEDEDGMNAVERKIKMLEGESECRSFFDKPMGFLASKIFISNMQVYVEAFEHLVEDYNTRSLKCLRLLNIQDFDRLEAFFKRGRQEGEKKAQKWRTERVNKVTRKQGMEEDKTYDRGLLVSPADAGKAMHILIQAAREDKTCDLAARLLAVCLGEEGEKGVLKTKLVLSGEYEGSERDGEDNKMAMSPIMVEQVRDMWACRNVEPWEPEDIIRLPDDPEEAKRTVEANPGLKPWVDVSSQMKTISTTRKLKDFKKERMSYTEEELEKERARIESNWSDKDTEEEEEKSVGSKKDNMRKKNCASAILMTLNLFDPKAGLEKPSNQALSKIATCMIKRNYVNCEIKDSGGNIFEKINNKEGDEYKSIHNLSALDIFPGDLHPPLRGLQVMTTAARVGAVEVLKQLMDAKGANFERVVGSKPHKHDNIIHAHPLSEIGKPERLLSASEYDIMTSFVERCCDEWQNREIWFENSDSSSKQDTESGELGAGWLEGGDNGREGSTSAHSRLPKRLTNVSDKRHRMVISFMEECEPLFDCAKNGHAPLVALFIKRYKEALELLVDDGAEDPEEEDKTKLCTWISQEKKELGKLGETCKLTPLYYAISQGHFSVVKLLVENGCKIDKESYEMCLAHRWSADNESYDELKPQKREREYNGTLRGQIGMNVKEPHGRRSKTRVYPEELEIEVKPRTNTIHQAVGLVNGEDALLGDGSGGQTESEKKATLSPMHMGRKEVLPDIPELGDDDTLHRLDFDKDDDKDYRTMEIVDEGDENDKESDEDYVYLDIAKSQVKEKEDNPLPSACLKVVDEMLLVIHKKPEGYWRRNKNLMYHIVPLMFTKLPLVYLLITVALWNGVGEYSDYSYEYETSMPRSALLYQQVVSPLEADMTEKAVDRATLADFVKDDLVEYFYDLDPYAELVGDVLLQTTNNETDLLLRVNATKAEAKITLEQFLDYDWLSEESDRLTISAVMKGEQAAENLCVVMCFDIGLPDSGGLVLNRRLFVLEMEKMASWESLFLKGDMNYLIIFEFLVGLIALIFVIFEIQDFFTGKRADDLALRTFWKAFSWIKFVNGFSDSSTNLQLDDEDTNFGEERKKEYKRVWDSAARRWNGASKKTEAVKYFMKGYAKVMSSDYTARVVRYWSKDGKILDFVQILSMLFWVFMRCLNFLLHMDFDFTENMGFSESIPITESHSNWKLLAIYHDMEVKFLALACLVIFVSIFKELRLFPTLGPQLRTTTKTVISSEVLFFTFLLIYLLLVFAFFGWVAFGARDQSFSTINAAVISFWGAMIGESLQESFQTGANNRLWGLVGYIFVSYIFSLVSLNIFIGVVGNRYNAELEKSQVNWESEVNAIISRRVMGKRKRMKSKEATNSGFDVEDFNPPIFKKVNIQHSLNEIKKMKDGAAE